MTSFEYDYLCEDPMSKSHSDILALELQHMNLVGEHNSIPNNVPEQGYKARVESCIKKRNICNSGVTDTNGEELSVTTFTDLFLQGHGAH